MKLKEKILHTTDEAGAIHDLSKVGAIAVFSNGIDNGVNVEDVFKTIALDEEEGEIYGTSLLSYFTPQEDGSLKDLEGNTVQLRIREGNVLLKVTEISRPTLYEDVDISADYIKIFSELLGITKPDELFTDLLSDTDKEAIKSEREAKELKVKTQVEADAKTKTEAEAKIKADADKAKADADKATADAEAIVQAEAEARAKIEDGFLVEEKKYKKYQDFYADLQTFKEYINGDVHFFYGAKWGEYNEDPFVLIKRGADFYEDAETDVDNITEDDKTVKLEFVDGGVRKTITLDIATNEISVAETEKK